MTPVNSVDLTPESFPFCLLCCRLVSQRCHTISTIQPLLPGPRRTGRGALHHPAPSLSPPRRLGIEVMNNLHWRSQRTLMLFIPNTSFIPLNHRDQGHICKAILPSSPDRAAIALIFHGLFLFFKSFANAQTSV